MKSRVIAAGTALLAVGCMAQELKPAPREWVEAVEALVGDKLTAKPLKARRILVFWRCEGFVHRDSIILGNETFEIAARKTGAFKVDLTRDYAALRAENLARYDALVLNNTTALKTDDPANSFIEPALLEYIRSGRGLAVIHAGADNFYKAGACAEMVGGLFLNHPWGAGGTWAFKVEEPDHPCCATSLKALAPVFKFSDEIYQQRSPFYNRPKLRVLVSLDLSDKATAEARGQQRADGDYAVSWVRPYGKGRVFYTSFAHDQRAWMHREILWHMLDGLQYAIGDLKADDTPHGLSETDLARIRATPDEAAASEIYAFLQDTLAHTGVKSVDEANIAKLRRLLTEPASTVFGRKAILRALMAVNSSITPTDITPFLKSATTRAWAIQTLAWLPGKAATETLAKALGNASDDERIELLGALALRRASAPVLTCLKDNNPQVAGAAMAALGQIADKAAVAALAVPAQGRLEAVRVSALAAALGGMTTRGEARRAAQTAKEIFKDRQAAPALRAAAARTLLVADARFFELAMEDPCPLVRGAVLRDTSNVPLKNLAHTHDKFSARALDLFRTVGDERSHAAVADTIFKRDGLKLFDQLQALFSDATCGAAARRTYAAFFESHVKGKGATEDIQPKEWKADASHNGREANRAFDRNPGTRWSSNRASEKDMWYTLDLGRAYFVSEAILDTEGSGNDTPNGCEIFASNDGKNWSGPIASVDGDSRKKTTFTLSVQTRHLKFVTTGGRQGLHWSIHELYLKAGLDPARVAQIEKTAQELK